jgi:hypothetical protein
VEAEKPADAEPGSRASETAEQSLQASPGAPAGDSASTETVPPSFPYGMPAEMGNGQSVEADGMYGEPIEMGYPEMGIQNSCPECNGYSSGTGFGAMPGQPWGPEGLQTAARQRQFFAEVELNFLRAHIMENFAGKLSEKYELSPRIIIGFDGRGLLDGRARYWHYGRDTHVLNGGAIRLEFDVVDLEATRRFDAGNSSIVIAAGLRGAKIDLTDDDRDSAGTDLLGMTFATDLDTPVCCYRQGQIYASCGARISILGGDWGQDDGNDFVPAQMQDDNVVVQELYAGFGYAWCYRETQLYSRLAFEMQNWHSDVLSQFAGGDSIGFIGPGVELGARF